MDLSITARGYKAPDKLKRYISDKLDRKKRVYEEVIDTEVILSYEKQIQLAEFKVKLNGKIIIVKEKSDDIFKSIDMALDNMERQIKRYKERRRDHANKKIIDNLVL